MAVTLTDVETAITTIQDSGQSFTLGDMTYNQGSLAQLIELRRQLLEETDRSDGTRPVFRGFKMSGMGY